MGNYALGSFNDARLTRVGNELRQRMVSQQDVCLRRLGKGRAGEVRFGRFINNERVSVEQLIEGTCAGIQSRCAGRHILAIEDTTEINYAAHAQRVKDLGTVGNGTDAGLFLHPVLAVDAQDGACIGLAHIHVWRRLEPKARSYRQLPIEDKESARWIKAAQAAEQRLMGAQTVTIVADRESDIYEMWARLPNERTRLLIRACRDRVIETENNERLFAWLSNLPVSAEYELELPAIKGKRSARTALLKVRFAPMTIKKPKHCSDRQAPATLSLWAIDITEDESALVAKSEQIHWRLLTTHQVETVQMARQCIEWYRQRWHIEQFFRTLKRQGLDLESSQLESGQGLEKLAVIASSAALKTMQLTLAREGNSLRPLTDVFTPEEACLLHQLVPTLEGATLKQKNRHVIDSLAWAAWIIARLGGWKGYASERKPGPITMLNGLQDFANTYRGWRLAREFKDVCIQ